MNHKSHFAINSYRCRKVVACFGIVAATAFASPRESISQETCNRQAGAVPLLRGQQLGGMFRISLDAPDFEEPSSIQQHLVFSTTWGRLISNELSSESRGLCGAITTAQWFPDLRVTVIVNRSTGNIDSYASLCTETLLSILLQSQPDANSMKRAASIEQWGRSLQRSDTSGEPYADATNILDSALQLIYERDTPLHSLISVDLNAYQQLAPKALAEWVEKQRSAQQFKLSPIGLCRTSEGERIVSSNVKVDRPRLASGIKLPTDIRLFRKAGGPSVNGVLRRAVIVGNAYEARTPQFVGTAASKYCEREHRFVIDGGLESTTILPARIHCLRESLFDLDVWLVFFCDPKDCKSEHEEQAIAAAIARDLDTLADAKASGDSGETRGPYLVAIEPTQK